MTWHRGRIQFFLGLVPPLGYAQVANVKLHWTEKVGDISAIKKVDSLRIVGWRLLLKQKAFSTHDDTSAEIVGRRRLHPDLYLGGWSRVTIKTDVYKWGEDG